LALAKVRRVGGSLVVTIPNELAQKQDLKPGQLVDIEVRKAKKSFFGMDRGIGPFTRDDQATDHD
jgi:antitoxin component of MazEF toxin-antitoxin module